MLPVSSDTLLRVGRRRARTDAGRLSVIGIDDWAFRRNHLYGTIACDLERRRIVALLPVPSGETCSTGNTNCVLSFTYQPYGVTLNFTPVVLSQGRIQLRVATEVTDIYNSKAITVSGTAVPAFRTPAETRPRSSFPLGAQLPLRDSFLRKRNRQLTALLV
jgi:hypothetical protein